MTESNALTDIRRLELEVARQLDKARSAAQQRVEQARRQAHATIAMAAAAGRKQAEERHEQACSQADARASEIRSDGSARAERLIAETMPYVGQAAAALVELVLSRPSEPEA